ncbi:MAG: 50S ribosomal protein L15 [Candidatus Omnitrophica bacterium]|nr:50S ribosomal protein L15 [Candidatus Omnitrophota bacterium]
MNLGILSPPKGARKRKKIVGRGPSSGHGKTSGRGVKGQTSRAGRHFYIGFEGGGVPLIRRLPKRGFSRDKLKKIYQIVNLKQIALLKYREVDPALLEENNLIKDKDKPIKILGDGEINHPITVKAHAFSKSAKEKIEKIGGKVEIIHA